jgi:hypothetical protein
MITAIIDAGQHYCQAVSDLWQWDYGQTLRIQGVKLPAAVEVQFSTTERIGETVTRIGVTQEGVTEVPIPDTLLEGSGTTQDYTIYAFVYIENGDSGKTEYRVSMKVRARPKPEAHATPEEGELFRQAIVAVAESADRAESARKSAETASDQAEDAKNAAEAAVGSAQASADEAKTAKANAETAAKVAEAFKTEAEAARSEAVRAATDATVAKKSVEEARAAAEKAKQDAEAAKAAADVNKEEAEAAQAKAEAAQKAAENAEAEAKKAQTATETAKTAVETMQSTVAGYADNANVAKESAETARSEAETAKNDAVQAKEAAEKAKSGTAADREVAEAASKAAQVSAISAEKSAERAETAKEEIQESADQIQKNATEIDSLKEDISNKITKFYASNQGETHIADSDNGKIQDMMIYGKSSQNGTPTPENPVEIKSVVNPTVKVCGKNLWNPILGGYISGNDGSIVKGLKTQIAVTDFIKTSGKDITVIARNFSLAIECSYAYRIGLYNAEKKWIKNIFPSGGNKYSINTFNITGTEYIRVSAPSGIYNTIQIEKGSEATPYEPYTEQSVQLPYTLNAIPVTSGGNVTIDGQQYIADYVDIESWKYVQTIQTDKVPSDTKWIIQNQRKEYSLGYVFLYKNSISTQELGMKNAWKSNMGDSSQSWSNGFSFGRSNVFWIVPYKNDGNITSDDINAWLVEHPMDIMYPLAEPIETDLTPEEIEAFKGLVTNYPVTNVSITSDQLDGYTVFNYPISMAEGWNYIKQQLNDNRDYIYDMDAKAQDIDTQAAEAYVNSEYAVALTELEV